MPMLFLLGTFFFTGCSIGREYRSEDIADEKELEIRRDTAVTDKDRQYNEIILDTQFGGTTRWYPLYNPFPEGFFNTPAFAFTLPAKDMEKETYGARTSSM